MNARSTDRVNVFLGELRRRRVFRAALYYLIASWTVVQVAATVFPLFEWPLWTIRIVLYGVVASFPLVVIGAWTFDLTPDGVRRTGQRVGSAQPAVGDSRSSVFARAFLYVVLGIAISSAGFGGYLYATRHLRQAETELRDQPGEDVPARAIILYSRAQVYEEAGRREQAIELYRTITLAFPDIDEAHERLAALTADSSGS